MTELELAWLAGLLEGEGSFCKGPPSAPNRPRIALQMTDEDVVRRAAYLMVIGYVCESQNKRRPDWKPTFRVMLRGRTAVALMKQLRPLMGARRQQQIDVAIASYTDLRPGDNTRKLLDQDVLEIRRAFNVSDTVLSRRFGVSRTQVRLIRVAG